MKVTHQTLLDAIKNIITPELIEDFKKIQVQAAKLQRDLRRIIRKHTIKKPESTGERK
jgi:site-specific DNA-adenine methylase